ncbi:MAG: peptidase domain protein [Cyanobacteria bacterium RYN_339]|nr:peptidase domain protein [Cyanobacteria bacterium RYN_339]
MLASVPVLTLILAIAPSAHAARSLARPAVSVMTPVGPVTDMVLANGLEVILLESHASPVVCFNVVYKVGSRNEGAGVTGSAHLLEHMLFKGTKSFGKGQIAQLLARNGAAYNATTWTDYTNFFETYAADRLELGFTIEASRMRDALILDAERQPEMTVVRNELEGDEGDPASLLYAEITQLAYRSHPYHHPVIGWRQDVEGVSTAQLKRFYDTYYQPNNAVAVLVGDFVPEKAIALAHKYFDRLPAGPPPPRVHTVEESQTGERRVVLHRRGETNLLQTAFHIPQSSSSDLAPLLVTDALLTTGQASRLHQALVESEEANNVWSEVGIQRDSSLVRIGVDLRPAHDGKTDHADVEAALWRALDRMRTTLVSPQELARAKRQTLAAYAFANEGVEEVAQELGAFAVRDRWQRGFELQSQIDAVSSFDVNRMIKTYYTRDNATTGWYLATPDGPLPPAPANLGGGKAVGNAQRVTAAPVQEFERHALTPAHPQNPQRLVLPNGLEVWLLEHPESRTIALDGFVRAGSAFDPPGKAGTGDAVANLIDAGTKHHGKVGLAIQLEDVGATLDFEGRALSTAFAGQCMPADLGRLVGALAERLREPTFPEVELGRLVNTLNSNLAQADEEPETRARRELSRAIFPPSHPLYQRTPAEQATSLEGLTREDLVAFHQRHYGPNATVVVLVGNFRVAQAELALREAFADWPRVEPRALAVEPLAPDVATHKDIPMPDKTSVFMVVGNGTSLKRNDPQYYAYALANEILGGDTWTSRLGAKLRDELGLTYGTYAELDAGLIPGAWDATVTANPANAPAALAALEAELARFVADGATADELAFAKRALVGNQAHLLATNSGMARAIARIAMFDLGEDYWARYPQLVNQATLDEVNAAARKLLHPDAAHVVIAGPPTGDAK